MEGPAGRIVVAADEAFLHATCSLYPAGSGVAFQENDVLALLQQLGINQGIDVDEIRRWIARVATTGEPVADAPVAAGRPPTPGEDAYLEFPPLKRRAARETDPPDPVALSHSRIVNVRAGTPAAIYHPLTDGVLGQNLRGEYLPCEPGRDRTGRLGRNLRRDGDRILATVDGRLLVDEGGLQIVEHVSIEGDLTVLQGDLDFVGNIFVQGNIESGLTVRGRKNIFVGGSIYGSRVICRGDLRVCNGIVGAEGVLVEVRGNLEAAFVENLKLRVWGNCRVRDSFVNTELLCGRSFVMPGRGHLVSGEVHAFEGIEVHQVGIPVGTKVTLAAGSHALTMRRIRELDRELRSRGDRVRRILEIDRKVGPMAHAYQSLSAARREEIERLLDALPAMQTRIAALRRERRQLHSQMQTNAAALIVVRGTVYEDAILEFPAGHMMVSAPTSQARFRFDQDQGKIVTLPMAA